jgi:hypothetical protein
MPSRDARRDQPLMDPFEREGRRAGHRPVLLEGAPDQRAGIVGDFEVVEVQPKTLQTDCGLSRPQTEADNRSRLILAKEPGKIAGERLVGHRCTHHAVSRNALTVERRSDLGGRIEAAAAVALKSRYKHALHHHKCLLPAAT